MTPKKSKDLKTSRRFLVVIIMRLQYLLKVDSIPGVAEKQLNKRKDNAVTATLNFKKIPN